MEYTNQGKKMSPAKRRKNRIQKAFKTVGEMLVGIQILATLVFLLFTWRLGMIPVKYLAVGTGILLMFALILLIIQVVSRGKAIISKVVSLCMTGVLLFGSMYLYRTHSAVFDIFGDSSSVQVDSMIVVVRADDAAQSVADTAGYLYGIQSGENNGMAETLAHVNEETGTQVQTSSYDSLNAEAGALLDGSVQAIIYNEGYGGMLGEVYPEYDSKVRVIGQYSIENDSAAVKEIQGKAAQVNVQNETFSVYISGIDVYGPIATNSRSDVNIIATVNPQTKQVLLTSTPRDYYVTIPDISGDQRDKLTHAGIYGVDRSMATLANLYGIDIPFYVRVNFTSLIQIVDMMGGVDVYSEYAFTTSGNGGQVMDVQQGVNHFDGQQALSFARERYNVPGGDNQRGKDQMAVIEAMIQKMMSPEMLIQAPSLIGSVSDSIDTNVSMDQIQKLVQDQLNNGGSWTIKSVAAEGSGDNNYCYSMPGSLLYVMNPDQASVDNIKSLMQMVQNGEQLPQ
ncbi:MAG TPA: LCP family protein [Candidatus Blautia merdavium]|uniref:LCP family protein n=1 Tax=Candidatus Blautia merdavium TaxID=2838494 RepID=A0A9D2TDG8_9FIRM|nr:LCP family protein [Candidatus Blautia merdavium]